jgi:Na+/melibiose symporter-like transporter
VITFVTTRERVQPPPRQQSNVRHDFAALLRSSPWIVMFLMTLFHFCVLSFRGAAHYNYYHHYADKAAMYDWLQAMGFTASGPAATVSGILETLGYIVHGDRSHLADSNVADVFNSIINAISTIVTILVLLLSAALSLRFGKKAVSVAGFALAAVGTLAFYLLEPTDIGGMLALTILIAACYAPTIPLIWAIYADVADYSEWKTGRRFTGVAFATMGFALKSGLALGSSSFLWIMLAFFDYDTRHPETMQAQHGFRTCNGIVTGLLFAICTVLLLVYKLDKRTTLQMADELTERRKQFSPA